MVLNTEHLERLWIFFLALIKWIGLGWKTCYLLLRYSRVENEKENEM